MNNRKITQSLPYFFHYVSTTYIFTFLNIFGLHEESAEIAISSSLILVIIACLSGDSRNIVLSNKNFFRNLVSFRILSAFFVVLPAIYFVSLGLNHNYLIILILIRKVFDWIEELMILEFYNTKYFLIQSLYLIPFPLVVIYSPNSTIMYVASWIFSTFILFGKKYLFLFTALKITKINKTVRDLLKNWFFINLLGSNLIVSFGNYLFRGETLKIFGTHNASIVISSIAIGGVIGSLISSVFLPSYISEIKSRKKFNSLKKYFHKLLLITSSLIFLAFIFITLSKNSMQVSDYFRHINIDLYLTIISFIGGGFTILLNALRFYIIQKLHDNTLYEDFVAFAFLLVSLSFLNIRQSIIVLYFLPTLMTLFTIYLYNLRYQIITERVGKLNTFALLILEFFLLTLFFTLAIKFLGFRDV